MENKAVKTEFSNKEKRESAEDLVDRVTDGRSEAFDIRITDERLSGMDWFSVYSDDGKIVLEGNNGVSVASALNHYLKEYCGWHYTWCGKNTDLPEVLPLPKGKVRKESPYKYRYYLNYCTFNYTMSWWDFERWQKEIDFMALNGINMPLAVTGQNSVWQRVYRKLGFSDEELSTFFSGPAYFNWFWMGNLDGWGGPLPQSFMDKHEALQKNILYAERSLGMTPILPAFTGHVPPAFSEKYPDAAVKTTSWVNFEPVTILEPTEPMFKTIGEMFLREQTELYGTNHYYTADTFNENLPPTNDSLYLSGMSSQVYSAMKEVDPEAVWVMQGWLFHHKRKFWGLPEIEALLSSVPDDKMLILDLWSERYPVWDRTNSYFGKPWIWCMLHNFGQNITLSGNVTRVANDPATLLYDPKAHNMRGIGLTMEGIEQNPAMYALMLENIWRDTPIDTDEFLKNYLSNRYVTSSCGSRDVMTSYDDNNETPSCGNCEVMTSSDGYNVTSSCGNCEVMTSSDGYNVTSSCGSSDGMISCHDNNETSSCGSREVMTSSADKEPVGEGESLSSAYRNALEAWKIIFSTAYENTVNNGGQESIITGCPNFSQNPGGTTNTNIHYDNADLVRAWDCLISCSDTFASSDGYRYDIVDVTRQVLANYASVLQQRAADHYRNKDIVAFRAGADAFLSLISDLDTLLMTRSEFLLGRWITSARNMGDNMEEKALYEKNARNLLTTWGNKDCRIRDYACRQWSGMMSGFYLPRWTMFFKDVEKAMTEGVEFDQKAFDKKSKDWEWSWVETSGDYPQSPEGDELQECMALYAKYRDKMNADYNLSVEGVDKEMI